jgi:UDP-N-acetylglucosamine transferase subunit ALG13
MRVVAVVGNKGPFDRLVRALEAYGAAHPEASIWVQHSTGVLPKRLVGSPVVERAELLARMREADVVVTHAGSGTVRDALVLGHRPVVVPRRAKLGEHVNDHQLELVAALEGRIEPVFDVADLAEAITRAAAQKRSPSVESDSAIQRALASRMNELASRRPARRAAMVWASLRALTWCVPVRHTETLKPR